MKNRKAIITELQRTLDERKQKYLHLIQTKQLHRDLANRYYLGMESALEIFTIMTDVEFQDLHQRYLRKKATKLKQGSLNLRQ